MRAAALMLAEGLSRGERQAVSRAITLAESSLKTHSNLLEMVLEQLTPGAAQCNASLRVGVSGPPGVGKSCFIEKLGLHLVAHGHRVAVLAVDPASPATKGALLADKTRMTELQCHPRAFVRPSSSCGELGGARRATAESIAIVEAAGFDRVIVESVGVGQSEIQLSQLTDCLLLLLPPVGGDALQACKKGIMEAADLLIVNKADGEWAPAAAHSAAEMDAALRGMKPRWHAVPRQVLTCSSMTDGPGITEVASWLARFGSKLLASGELATHRQRQIPSALEAQMQYKLLQAFHESAAVRAAVERQHAELCFGRLSARKAADVVLNAFFQDIAARRRETV